MNTGIIEAQTALIDVLGAFPNPIDINQPVTVSSTEAGCNLESSLPSVWVRRGRMTGRSLQAADLYQDTRNFQLLCYVAELCNNASDEAAYDNAVRWITPLHAFLARQSHSLMDAPGVTFDIANIRDSGDVSLFVTKGKRYAGVAFTVPLLFLTRY